MLTTTIENLLIRNESCVTVQQNDKMLILAIIIIVQWISMKVILRQKKWNQMKLNFNQMLKRFRSIGVLWKLSFFWSDDPIFRASYQFKPISHKTCQHGKTSLNICSLSAWEWKCKYRYVTQDKISQECNIDGAGFPIFHFCKFFLWDAFLNQIFLLNRSCILTISIRVSILRDSFHLII